MKNKIFAFLLSAALLFSISVYGCNKKDNTVYVSGERTTYYGDDNGEALHNPLMGWSCYLDSWEIIRSDGIPDEFDVGYILCSWDEIEPVEGEFDFSAIDRAIKILKRDGKTVMLRFYLMPDLVWNIKGLPDWLFDKIGIENFKYISATAVDGVEMYYHPPYGNKQYQACVKACLEALAEHYPDGAVDVIDNRVYGIYGEWDSNWGNYWTANDRIQNPLTPEDRIEKERILNELIEIYKEVFGDYELTKIAQNVSGEYFDSREKALDYLKETALDNAYGSGFAIRYDATDNQLQENSIMRTILDEYFPQNPVFSESNFGWSTTMLNIDSTYASFCKERVNIATFGFYTGNYQNAIAWKEDFFTATLKPNDDGDVIGYRIIPSKVTFNKEANSGGRLHFSSEWKNTGAGVLYRHYPLGLSLKDSTGKEVYFAVRNDFNITSLIKESSAYTYETTFNLPKADELPKGEYTVEISLVDKNDNYRNAIAMPIGTVGNTARSYPVGKLLIK